MIRKLVGMIGVATVLAGLGQVALPVRALAFLASTPPASPSIFLIVTLGLFTTLFGAALLHETYLGVPGVATLWAGAQKLVGAASVLIAVAIGALACRALLVTGFDAACGVVILVARVRSRGGYGTT